MLMTLDHMLDACVMGTDPVIEFNKCDYLGRVIDTAYYNSDTVPSKYLDFPVSYIETAKQFDGSTALIFTVYDHNE